MLDTVTDIERSNEAIRSRWFSDDNILTYKAPTPAQDAQPRIPAHSAAAAPLTPRAGSDNRGTPSARDHLRVHDHLRNPSGDAGDNRDRDAGARGDRAPVGRRPLLIHGGVTSPDYAPDMLPASDTHAVGAGFGAHAPHGTASHLADDHTQQQQQRQHEGTAVEAFVAPAQSAAHKRQCSADDDCVSPEALASVLRERRRFLERREASDAVLAAAGGAASAAGASGFNPIAVVEAVTDAVIEDMIDGHVEEMLSVCDHYAEVMFAEEFAAPEAVE